MSSIFKWLSWQWYFLKKFIGTWCQEKKMEKVRHFIQGNTSIPIPNFENKQELALYRSEFNKLCESTKKEIREDSVTKGYIVRLDPNDD